MTAARESFQEIDEFGVVPLPSGAGAILLQCEEGRECYVVLRVLRVRDRVDLMAIVTFSDCLQSVFGYPNDEAYWHDPRGDDDDHPGYGFYEVLNSTWPARLAEYNEHAFPGRLWPWDPHRHFFLGFHDGSGQFLARDMRVEVFDADFDAVIREAVGRGFGL